MRLQRTSAAVLKSLTQPAKSLKVARERLPKDLRSTRDPGGAVRYRETTPATIQSALQTELVEGAETAILTRTHKEAAADSEYAGANA